MPWKRAKALPPPDNSLFEACFRIQREASEAAGRHVPLVVENVRGAQPYVGRARWHFGSFYLWGDVPALMPMTRGHRKGPKKGTGNQLCVVRVDQIERDDVKVGGFRFDGSGRSFQSASVESLKGNGGSWFGDYQQMKDGLKQGGDWFNASQPSISRMCSSKSKARKAASAHIAKIPFVLARHIARVYHPETL